MCKFPRGLKGGILYKMQDGLQVKENMHTLITNDDPMSRLKVAYPQYWNKKKKRPLGDMNTVFISRK